MNSPRKGHAGHSIHEADLVPWRPASATPPLQLVRVLHDELCQLLSLGLVHLAQARREVPETETLHKAEARMLDALQSCRRLIEQLRKPAATPAVADFADLAAGLHRSVQALADQHQQQLGFSALGHTEQLPPGTVQTLLTASQGLLINACQHGRPSSARLCLVGGHRQLRISVTNTAARSAVISDQLEAVGSGGQGLSLVREQLATIDAQLLWQRHKDRVHAAILWPARRSAA
ncbi:hypothetical protein ACS5PK_01935 [Roseateles sp. DB2]|uniref:hypothetical protein n=1 Tax=Roseateles sp. DB2 TaxID=3453717 RepID=UPI003EF08A9A